MPHRITYSYDSYPDNPELTRISQMRARDSALICDFVAPGALLCLVLTFANKENWIYWLIAFLVCAAILAYMIIVYPKNTRKMIDEKIKTMGHYYRTSAESSAPRPEFHYCALCHDLGFIDDGTVVMYENDLPLCSSCNKKILEAKAGKNINKHKNFFEHQIKSNNVSQEGKALVSTLFDIDTDN